MRACFAFEKKFIHTMISLELIKTWIKNGKKKYELLLLPPPPLNHCCSQRGTKRRRRREGERIKPITYVTLDLDYFYYNLFYACERAAEMMKKWFSVLAWKMSWLGSGYDGNLGQIRIPFRT
jgi:hypothetical protein